MAAIKDWKLALRVHATIEPCEGRAVPVLIWEISGRDERLCRKEYFKTNVKEIFDREGYEEMQDLGDLPEDTSNVFFILKKKQTRPLPGMGNGSCRIRS